MPDLEEIIDGLREGWDDSGAAPWVWLSDAVAAVHAAADARTQEIVDALGNTGEAGRYLSDYVARRFPNGGTP